MAYYLTIKEKNNYKALNISTLGEFKRLSKFKSSSYSLEELDLFTSKFNNEIELKTTLYKKGIIKKEDLTRKIEVRRKSSGKLEKVQYDLVFREQLKYLDIQYLMMKILSFSSDKEFLNKLLKHYRNSYNQEALRQINSLIDGYSDNDIRIESALNLFFKDEIFLTNYNTGVTKIKYKSLHDLAMFIYNHEKIKEEKTVSKEEQKKALEQLKNELIKNQKPENIEVKKKVRKKREELEGQISFFTN